MKTKLKLSVALVALLLSVLTLAACGSEEEDPLNQQEPATKCEHVFGEYEVSSDPTCYYVGTEIAYCEKCGISIEREIPMTNHTAVTVQGYAAGCESEGLTDGEICTVCTAPIVKQTTVPALGHEPITAEMKESSCTEHGYSAYEYCGRCSENITYPEELPLKEHARKDVKGLDPTCEDSGYTASVICDDCGYTITPPSYLPALEHDTVIDYGYAASCTEKGLSDGEHCERCGKTLIAQEPISEFGHDVRIDTGYAASCTEDGLSDGEHCERCKAVLKAQAPVPAVGHIKEAIKGTAPTCETGGSSDGSLCSVCGTVFRTTSPLDKLGHSFEDGVCSGCGIELSEGLYFEELGDGYVLAGIGDFEGTELVIPSEYNGKSVLGIKQGALASNTTVESIVIIDGITYIDDNAFAACTALKSVKIPASVSEIGDRVFDGCTSLSEVNVSDFKQLEEWDGEWLGTAEPTVGAMYYGGKTPFEIYTDAMEHVQRNIDRFSSRSVTKMDIYVGGVNAGLSSTSISNYSVVGNEMYIYQPSPGDGVTDYEIYYVGGMLYTSYWQNGTHYSSKVSASKEYIRALGSNTARNLPKISEKYFDIATFTANADGGYSLVLDMDPMLMSDAIMAIFGMEGMADDMEFTFTKCVFYYTFDEDGYIVASRVDAIALIDESIEARYDISVEYSDVGTLEAIVLPSYTQSYPDLSKAPCASHYNIVEFEGYEPTCLASGFSGGSYCNTCLVAITESVDLPATGHSFVGGKCTSCGVRSIKTNGLVYELDETESYYKVIGVDNNMTEITVPESFLGMPVKEISEGAFDGSRAKIITIPTTIEKIENGALAGADLLEELTLPYLGVNADESGTLADLFGSAESVPAALKKITVLGGKELADGAFSGASGLEIAVIAPTVESAHENAFDGCGSLMAVECPISVVCALPKSVTTVVLNGGKVIPSGAFVGFENLKEITLPKTLTGIENGAFDGCNSLYTVRNLSGLEIVAGSDSFGGIAKNAVEILGAEDEEPDLYEDGDFLFYTKSDGSTVLIDYTGSDESIVLPEGTYTVKADAFDGCELITSITVPESVTIEDGTFDGYGLKSVTATAEVLTELPLESVETLTVLGGDLGENTFSELTALETLTLIGISTLPENAFAGCTELTSVELGDVTAIPAGAFSGCTALTAIGLGGIKSIGNGAFEGAPLRELDLSSLEAVGNGAFVGLTSLERVSIGKAASIGSGAFAGCTSLKYVTVTAATYIGDGAFEGCPIEELDLGAVPSISTGMYQNITTLKKLTLGSATYIGAGAFAGCTALETVILEKTSAIYDGAFEGCPIKTLVFGGSTSISDNAFMNITTLESLDLGAATSIGKNAFSGCTSLKSVNLKNVKTVGAGAFAGCPITSLDLSSVTTIGSGAFNGANIETVTLGVSSVSSFTGGSGVKTLIISGGGTLSAYSITAARYPNIETLIIDNSITKINSGALSGITTLKSISLPFIGSTASSNDRLGYIFGLSSNNSLPASLTSVTVTGSTSIPSYAFAQSSHLTEIVICEGVTEIGANAFERCTNLTSLSLPEGLLAIGSYAFSSTSSLVSIEIPSTVTTLSANAFASASVESITLPAGITKIPANAFINCGKLTEIEFLGEVTDIGYYAFGNTSKLAFIDLPESVVSIGANAFNSSGITSFTVRSTYTSLGESFLRSSKITELVIEDGVTSIPNYAFAYCSKLEKAVLPASVTTIGSNAFAYCTALMEIEVGEGLASIGSYAFDGCTRLSLINNYSTLDIKPNTYTNGYIALNALYVNTVRGTHKSFTAFGDFIFLETDDFAYLVAYTGGDGALTLPETIGDKAYGINQYAFSGATALTSIDIPETVTSIGAGAFTGCARLESIIGGEGIEQIGANALSPTAWYNALTEDEVYLGKVLIRYAKAITADHTITVKDGTTSIMSGAVPAGNKTLIAGIILPSSITSANISGYYFTSVTAPAEVAAKLVSTYTLILTVNGGKNVTSSIYSYVPNLLSLTVYSGVEKFENFSFYCPKVAELFNYSGIQVNVSGLLFSTTEEGYSSHIVAVGDYYFYKDDVTCALIHYAGSETELTLPSEGPDGSDYSIGDKVFKSSSITSVIIPDCVTEIGAEAFNNSKYLTSVTIGSGVTVIGDSAFASCTTLSSVEFNCSLSEVGYSAFKSTPWLSAQPAGPIIHGGAFFGYSGTATELTLDDSVNAIASDAFSNLTSLTKLSVPVGVVFDGTLSSTMSITDLTCPLSFLDALSNSSKGKVKFLTILDGEAIDQNDFLYFSNITKITLPDTMKTISGRTFWRKSALVEIDLGGTEEIGNNAFSECKALVKVTGTENLRVIEDYAFNTCSLLEEIELPTTLESIGVSAFGGCSSLKAIKLPDDMTEIPKELFRGCSSLASIEFPSGLTSIGSSAFSDCASLTELDFPSSLKEIKDNAFQSCTGLTELTLIAGIETISNDAFTSCTSLKTLYVECALTTVRADVFNKCTGLAEIYCPAEMLGIITRVDTGGTPVDLTVYITGGTKIANNEFYGFNYLTRVVIADTVTEIGANAFEACKRLKTVEFGSSVETIGTAAFYQCEALESITLPDCIRTVGSNAFGRCYKLANVDFGEGVTTLEYGSFALCYALTEVVIPESVTSMASPFIECTGLVKITGSVNAINSCGVFSQLREMTITSGDIPSQFICPSAYPNEALTSITILDGVTSIGTWAFAYLRNVKQIEIPATVKHLPDYAFAYSSITSVKLNEGLESIGDDAFFYCSVTTVEIPSTVKSVGRFFVGTNTFKPNIYNGAQYVGNAENPYMVLIDASAMTGDIHEDTEIIAYGVFDYFRNTAPIVFGTSVKNISCVFSAYYSTISAVYFKGTEEEFDAIEKLAVTVPASVTVYFYSETEPEKTEDESAYAGNFWRNVDGVPTPWTL